MFVLIMKTHSEDENSMRMIMTTSNYNQNTSSGKWQNNDDINNDVDNWRVTYLLEKLITNSWRVENFTTVHNDIMMRIKGSNKLTASTSRLHCINKYSVQVIGMKVQAL